MERGAFARGDDIGSGARPRGFRNLDLVVDVERGGDAGERGLRLWKQAVAEIATGDGDAQTVGTARDELGDRLDRILERNRIVGIMALHGVVGERQIAGAACERADVIETRHERKGVRA